MKSILKRVLVVTLSLSLLIASVAVASVLVQGDSATTIAYEFTGADAALAGYAEGTVTITPGTSSRSSGYYTLYWANDTEILPDYRYVAQANITGSAVKVAMEYKRAIPEGATKLAVFETPSDTVTNTSLDNAAAVFEIPADKKFAATKRYDFAMASDAHIGCSNTYTSMCSEYYSSVVQPAGFYNNAEYNLSKAMAYYAASDAEFMVFSGDMADSGQTAQYQSFYNIYDKSGFKGEFYAVNGNHDRVASFVNETGNPGLYYEVTENDDHFLMLGMSNDSAKTDAVLTAAELDWLESKLSEYAGDGHNVFIVMHPHIGNYTPGDATPPTHGSPMSMNGSNVKRLVSLLEAYPQSIYMCGHTHLILEQGINYGDRNGTTARMFHVPSIGAAKIRSTDLASAGGVDQHYNQGYLVSVYEDCLVYTGIDFQTGESLPFATYIIPTEVDTFGISLSTNLKVTGTTTGLHEGDKVDLTLAASTQNYLIDSLTVTGVTDYEWNAETGALSFTMPGRSVSITATTKREQSEESSKPEESGDAPDIDPSDDEKMLGDVTGDENINASDATRILLSAVGKVQLTHAETMLADVNKDGSVNSMDATLILLHSVAKRIIDELIVVY